MTNDTGLEKRQQLESLQGKLAKDFGEYLERMLETIKRAVNLGRVSAHSEDAGDVLRASVVFTHAALEDFLRTLAQLFLPEANEQTLNEIPLAGLTQTGRAEKFYLGKLALHRGKSVNDLIRESVMEYLDKTTFNNVTEVASLLERVGLDASKHSEGFQDLEAMMKRRHLIVHRADRKDGVLQPISGADVARWIEAVHTFMQGLLPSLFAKEYPPEVLAKKYGFRLVSE